VGVTKKQHLQGLTQGVELLLVCTVLLREIQQSDQHQWTYYPHNSSIFMTSIHTI
jgi:hypothetical protein